VAGSQVTGSKDLRYCSQARNGLLQAISYTGRQRLPPDTLATKLVLTKLALHKSCITYAMQHLKLQLGIAFSGN